MRLGLPYFLRSRDPAAFRAHVREMAEAGATYVVLIVTDFDVLFFRPTVGQMVAVAKQEGLEVFLDPWGLGGIFCTPYSVFPLRYPEACQRLSDGTYLPRACPSSSEWQTHLAHWLELAAEAGADGVFWDEPQFASEAGSGRWACRCHRCQARYQAETGEAMPVALTAEVLAFRRRQALAVLAEACAGAAAAGLRNTLCLLPFTDEVRRFAEWEAAAGLPQLESLGIDPYPAMVLGYGGEAAWLAPPERYLAGPVERLLAACRAHGKRPHVWLQAFDVPAGVEGQIVAAARWLKAAGIEDVALWSDRWGTGDNRRSRRPEAVWQAVREALAVLRAD